MQELLQGSARGLYRPEFEKDSCGFGLIAQMDGATSHKLVTTAIEALARMTHRGAVAADGKTGDGCGLLLAKPSAFLNAVAADAGFELGELFTAGMIFLSQDEDEAASAREELNKALSKEGLTVAGWREVPTDSAACGEQALKSLPRIEQVFVNAGANMDAAAFEAALFMAGRRSEQALAADEHYYVCSLSNRVLSYKGLVMPAYLPEFYLDLSDERLETKICVFHQRFSTNTLPQWRLAQPFRMLAHNGEINTVRGNRNWAVARGTKFKSPLLPELADVQPLVNLTGSDSSSLDNMLDVLNTGGVDIFRAMRTLIPPAWQNVDTLDSDLRAFYEYHSMHMEPWDGPAGIVLTDGRYAACVLDRNGLRPARYVITKDRIITLASEMGVTDYASADVVAKGRLRPGQMLAVDTDSGELLLPDDIDNDLKSREPWKKWLHANASSIQSTMGGDKHQVEALDPELYRVYEKMFLLSFEERDQVIRVLAEAGQEAIGSMGDDTPFPILSSKYRSVYDSFRQQFAQVTNPPIDPLRETIVMSLETVLGREQNLFETKADYAKRISLDSPVLSTGKFRQIANLEGPDYAVEKIQLNYAEDQSLPEALAAITQQAADAVRGGKTILILTDRKIAQGKIPVHALLATGAVHHRLIAEGLRSDANIILETATARDSHHFACLIGYGATAVYPYLAYEALYEMRYRTHEIKESKDYSAMLPAYRKGINKGLHKIMSKMGISTIASYRGAQLFEIVGMADEVADLCFKGTTCRVQGMDFSDIESDQRELAKLAWNRRKQTEQGGLYKFVHGGEYHAYNPDVIRTLHDAVQNTSWESYQEYAELVNTRPVSVLRDLFEFNSDRELISIDEVEDEQAILQRFDSAGMSLGALSPEAHEALAIAMNRLGGRSNSGEGGEDPARYGTEKVSKIKQIASGRFGVTPHYLSSAEVLQIKVAQGAKPGEGGQLPGHKVQAHIAKQRYATPGVALISPPPHHDIYSIEDLAQLIFDLKQVNPDALVSVKLVSEPGVGTIAAGVAKAYADLITISGYDGGTGASPLTSVRYAGSPWELGLAETHHVLRANDLRGKVRVQTDGGLKTGVDVLKAAMLGAESFGFGTAPMVALGCKYLRICHLNNCATGVATQDNTLRMRHFIGLPEMVENYFRFLVRETRELLAQLGYRSLEELIGRADLLKVRPGDTARQDKLDLSPILTGDGLEDKPNYCITAGNEPFDKGELAETMVADCMEAIENKSGGIFNYDVRNIHRSIGARLSGEIAKRHGNLGMESAPITLRLTGTAGQSFGVWNAGGLNMTLEGDANDYVGKGMAGGKLVIHPPADSSFNSQDAAIIGNTCLYGATGGKLFAAGVAGERFAVRNSGATAVVEGCGDHGCEYMTGGMVAILGETGVNFGAGMTGGFAFVLDRDRRFVDRYNHELIDIQRISHEALEAHRYFLRGLIEEYVAETGSAWGQEILDDFRGFVSSFWLVKPKASDVHSLIDTLQRAA